MKKAAPCNVNPLRAIKMEIYPLVKLNYLLTQSARMYVSPTGYIAVRVFMTAIPHLHYSFVYSRSEYMFHMLSIIFDHIMIHKHNHRFLAALIQYDHGGSSLRCPVYTMDIIQCHTSNSALSILLMYARLRI